MCGITGLLNLDGAPAPADILDRMTDLLAHRGPDGRGVFRDGPLGLGHRRLAIIDLSPAGAQPMRRGDLTISYNGELYNFQELRAELESRGHAFASRSDTEVVLAAYAHWGPDCLKRFNGMFALAVWDAKERTLFLARDRYGVKPLYYACFGERFLFGSEWKAILAHPAAQRRLDLEALAEYFVFQNLFTDRTLVQGVRLLPPGHHLTIAPGQGEPRIQRYWNFDFLEPAHPRSPEEYAEEMDALFSQAVRRQMVSDVDVGSYLSGGIDSGSITCLAAQERPGLRTFTCGFDLHSATGLEMGFDERVRAEHMSYLFRTEHYEVVLKAGDMERVMPSLVWHLEEPRVGQCYPNYYVARLASRFVKVALSGAGGDELFGGYPWRYWRGASCADLPSFIDNYFAFWQRLLDEDQLRRVFAPVWDRVRHQKPRDIFVKVINGWEIPACAPEHFINLSLSFEAKTFLHGLLMVEDKLSMAHGLETRVPFLDNDLVDFAMRLPVRLKVRDLRQNLRLNENEPGSKTQRYFQRTGDGKVLLRQVLGRFVGEDIHTAPKQGFAAPDASWFRGESMDYVRSTLFNGRARIYQILDRDAVRGLVTDHLEGRINRRLLIWSLLNVEQWLHTFGDVA